MAKDWDALNNENGSDETETVATAPAPAPAPAVTKPKVFAHPSRPGLVLPDPDPRDMAQSPGAAQTPTPLPVEDNRPDADPLPSNYMECFPILKRLQGMLGTAQSRAQAADIRARIAAVSIHINRITNEAPRVEIDHNASRAERAQYIGSAEQRRNERMAALQAADERGVWKPIVPGKTTPKPLADFLRTPEGTAAVVTLRPALAAYEYATLEAFTLLSPQMRKQEHAVALHSHPSEEVTKRIVDEAALIGSSHFNLLSRNKQVDLQKMFDATVKPGLLALLQAALVYLNSLKDAAILAEKKFFQAQGVPYAPTAVGKQFDPHIGYLQRCADNITDPFKGRAGAPVLPGYNHAPPAETVLQTVFGVSTLPDPAQ